MSIKSPLQNQIQIQILENKIRIKENEYAVDIELKSNVKLNNNASFDELRKIIKNKNNIKSIRALVFTSEPPDDPSYEDIFEIDYGDYYVDVTVYYYKIEIKTRFYFANLLSETLAEELTKTSIKEYIEGFMKTLRAVVSSVMSRFVDEEEDEEP